MATKKIQVIGMKGPKGDPGATGPQGPAGPAGPKGENGADGVGISSIEQTKTATEDGGENILTITLTNEEKTEFKVRNGSKGNPGDGGSGEGGSGEGGTGGGLEYGIYVGDTQPTNGVMYWLDTSGDSGVDFEPETPDTPVEPEEPEVTLSSISAVYNGGDVAVGTELSALTGITVTAKYSDGSTATVTDYTLSGSIAEGSNTITVSYGGKTTTFTVTGVAEEEEEGNLLDNALAVMEGKNLNAFYNGGFKLGNSETSTLYIVPIEAGIYRIALKVDKDAYKQKNNTYYMFSKLFKDYANLTATGTVTTGSKTHAVGVSTGDYTGLNTSGYTNTDVYEVVSTSDITQEDNDSGERWLWIDFTYDRSGWIFVQKDTAQVLGIKVTKVVA